MGRKLFVLLAVTVLAASDSRRVQNARTLHAAGAGARARLHPEPGAESARQRQPRQTHVADRVDRAGAGLHRDVLLQGLDSLDKVNDTYSNQLRMQAIYSQAGFILQHPKVKSDAEKQAAGLAGALRAYRAIQRFDPTAQYPVLDNLSSLEKQGKLVQYVEQQTLCTDN